MGSKWQEDLYEGMSVAELSQKAMENRERKLEHNVDTDIADF